MKNIQIKKQHNQVYTGLAIDIDVTIGSNLYIIRGIYNTLTKKAKLNIVEIDSHRYLKSHPQDLLKWCKKSGYDYTEMVEYIINNFKK